MLCPKPKDIYAQVVLSGRGRHWFAAHVFAFLDELTQPVSGHERLFCKRSRAAQCRFFLKMIQARERSARATDRHRGKLLRVYKWYQYVSIKLPLPLLPPLFVCLPPAAQPSPGRSNVLGLRLPSDRVTLRRNDGTEVIAIDQTTLMAFLYPLPPFLKPSFRISPPTLSSHASFFIGPW